MRAEARVLILGRTSWHYDGGRRTAAARPPQARWCARVSEKVAGRAMPDFSKVRPLRRVPAALRSHTLRAASRRHCPRVRPALAAHTLDEDSPAYGNVSRAGDGCGVVVSSTKRRWHDHRPASQTGQGGACSRSARNRRSPPLPRPEQLRLRVEGSPLSRGRRDHCPASKPGSKPREERLRMEYALLLGTYNF